MADEEAAIGTTGDGSQKQRAADGAPRILVMADLHCRTEESDQIIPC